MAIAVWWITTPDFRLAGQNRASCPVFFAAAPSGWDYSSAKRLLPAAIVYVDLALVDTLAQQLLDVSDNPWDDGYLAWQRNRDLQT